MNKCIECGHKGLTPSSELMEFNGVAKVEGIAFTCPECGERYEGFEHIEALSRVVAHHIARQAERLTPAEVRFLRKYLGYSGKDFAAFLGVAPETVSRWESASAAKRMSLSTEKLLRYMAVNEKPISHYGLDQAGSLASKTERPLFKQYEGTWIVA